MNAEIVTSQPSSACHQDENKVAIGITQKAVSQCFLDEPAGVETETNCDALNRGHAATPAVEEQARQAKLICCDQHRLSVFPAVHLSGVEVKSWNYQQRARSSFQSDDSLKHGQVVRWTTAITKSCILDKTIPLTRSNNMNPFQQHELSDWKDGTEMLIILQEEWNLLLVQKSSCASPCLGIVSSGKIRLFQAHSLQTYMDAD
ncbi:hypothetical protein HAX54_024889 [Datura stramonium]|uniref:Uncharacterized protein n=1 Tax=Datura stramonium TaxID=4076 RepID=A0ABS8S5Q1_DATST|nr:hypothetical protein [Datura stramonium]